MIASLLLAAALCPHPHRSQSAVRMFVHANPCPKFVVAPDGKKKSCAIYRDEVDDTTGKAVRKLWRRCGGCAVDHKCPLGACGLDAPRNMQWLDADKNREKSDDASLCTRELLDPVTGWKRDWEMPP